MPVSSGSSAYMPQLDRIRALVIVGVLVVHFVLEEHILYRSGHWGRLGVLLFFVLSDYLIMGIRLRSRDAAMNDRQSQWREIWNFYMRRVPRVLLIYYLTLVSTFYVGYVSLHDTFLWHATYTTNIGVPMFEFKFENARHRWSNG